jgi:hypothetical protein
MALNQSIKAGLRVLGLGHVPVEVRDGQVMEPDGAVDAARRGGHLTAGAISEGGVVIIRVDRASIPVAAPLGAQKVCCPVRRVDKG